MIYYHMFNEINLIPPPRVFDHEMRLRFSQEMYRLSNPILAHSREALLAFNETCAHLKLVHQCDQFAREHKAYLPSVNRETKQATRELGDDE